MQPPIFTPYEPPPQPPPPMRVRLDGLSDAWNVVKVDYSPFIIALLLMVLVMVAVILPVEFALGMATRGAAMVTPNPFSNFPTFILLALPSFLGGVLQVYLSAASQRIVLLRLRGYGTTIAEMTNFDGNGMNITIWAFAFATVSTIVGLISAAAQSGQAVAPFSSAYFASLSINVVLGLVIATLTLFVPLMIIDQRKSVLEAVAASAAATGRVFFPALGMYILVSFAGAIGLFACCIGVFFTLPIMLAWPAVLYNDFYRPNSAAPPKENEFYPRPQF